MDQTTLKKKFITTIYHNIVEESKSTAENLAQKLCITKKQVKELYYDLEKEGLVSKEHDEFKLTPKGRSKIKVVFTGGVFDIIHPGHIFTLASAKKLGDFLVVVIARDMTVLKNKGRNPLNNENQRRELVNSIKTVDMAILGGQGDIIETVLKVNPDIITLGYDQKHNEDLLCKELEERNISIKLVRLKTTMPEIKSSEIIKNNRHIIEEF